MDQLSTKVGSFFGVERYDQATAAFERNSHDDDSTFFGDFHRSVTSTRLHRSHL
jgi:hypothetical protein